ncbi:response regulator [Hyunsoonleella rubra]|uniref:Response regulator n=1 Tax=Hyunsoonleella rubra TaxID=1737062 RepID=A0ABW5TCM5_9FLAO
MKHKVVIIEDNIPLRDGFAQVINSTETFKVISVYDNCEDAIKNVKKDSADVYLMDIELPGMNGVEGTKRLKDINEQIDVLVVTVHENSETVFDALCAGATGYLTKSLMPEQLIEALNQTISGGAPMSIKIAKMVVSSFKRKPSEIELSTREKEVLTLLSDGNSYDVIADKLFLSKNTIKFHIKNIYGKLQVNSNVKAVQKANRENLI